MGVKIVTDVDKAGFQKIADPYLDKLAKELGPHADKIKALIRAINWVGCHSRRRRAWRYIDLTQPFCRVRDGPGVRRDDDGELDGHRR